MYPALPAQLQSDTTYSRPHRHSNPHINADSGLLAAVEQVDIPIQVSLYSVIRDTCLGMDPHDCLIVANVINEALGSTKKTWQTAVRASRVAVLQPKKTERVIAILKDGCCRDQWGPFWLKAVRLSQREVKNFAYHDRMMVEVRRGTR
jgi:hypothetical protein